MRRRRRLCRRRRHRARLYARPGHAARPERIVPDRQGRRDGRSVFSERSRARPRSAQSLAGAARRPEGPVHQVLPADGRARRGSDAAVGARARSPRELTSTTRLTATSAASTCGFIREQKVAPLPGQLRAARAHGLRHRHDPQARRYRRRSAGRRRARETGTTCR